MRVDDIIDQLFDLKDMDAVRQLTKAAVIRRIPRRRMLVREGEMQEYIDFVISGCLCGISQNCKGEKVVLCFCCRPGEAAMASFSMEEPATASMIALTDSHVLSIPLSLANHLVNSSVECLRIYNQLLQQALRRLVTTQVAVCRGSAMERYQWFQQEYPGLIEVVSNKYIASYLQMTNVTLSRLRRIERESRQSSAQPLMESSV